MHRVVVNTGPLLALIACGHLDALRATFDEVWIPREVCDEVEAGGPCGFGYAEFRSATWAKTLTEGVEMMPILTGLLDRGEAAVIQVALDHGIDTVCIDEHAGRRVARMSGLMVTGSLGVLIKATRLGHPVDVRRAIDEMRVRGVRLSDRLIAEVLEAL